MISVLHKEDIFNYWRGWASLPILLLPLLTGMPDGSVAVLYGLLIWFALNDMNFLLHQHVHCPITSSKIQNTVLDWLLSIVTGMCAYNWRQQHVLRHHHNDNSWGGSTTWEFSKNTFLRSTVYSLKKSAAMYWYPLKEAAIKSLSKQQTGPINYKKAMTQHCVTGIMMICLIYLEPYFYISYYFFVYFFTTKTDYDNHVGCDDSHYGFSNNTMNETYNIVRNNFGFHTAHHYYPKAHWTQLPELHKKIFPNIPSRCISNQIWTGYWTPPLVVYFVKNLYLKSMVLSEAGKN